MYCLPSPLEGVCCSTEIHHTRQQDLQTPSELFLGRHVSTRLSMLKPDVSERVRVKQEKQMLAGPQANRHFQEGDRVWCETFTHRENGKRVL